MPPQISVIIPARNSAAFIAEAIQSALAQQDVSLEIILVDGASTDGTVERARAADPGIRWLSEPDKGVSDGRNKGIRLSRAPWIAFLDADDIWRPDKLRRQLQLAASDRRISLVFCDAWQFRNDEIILESFLQTREKFASLPKREVAKSAHVLETDMATEIMQVNYVVTTSTAIVRRDVCEAIGGFDTGLSVCEDYDFWIRLLKGYKAGVIAEPLVGYRHHGKSLSDDTRAMVEGRIRVAEKAFRDASPYPAGAIDFFRGEKARRLRQLGRMDIHDGDVSRARREIAQSLRLSPSLSSLALLAATLFGPKARHKLLSIKERLGFRL